MELIRATIDRRTAELPQGDLAVLGYWEWREALERGIAAHHAGLLPAFKETVEELFVRGLVRAVFATETLALGINMPARTVVLERLVKFNGESHAELTPGEYTQLTGRAGRRGIDVEGHAVVIWQPGVDPEQVAGLASTRTYPLRSSFRPGYNMAVNLVGRLGVEAARELLEQSFGQFQADRSVVGLARRIERNGETLAGYAASMRCHLGDFTEYAALRRRVSEREKALARQGIADSRDAAAAALRKLKPGDVIAVPVGRRAGLAVVLDPGLAGDADPRPLVLTEDRWAGRLSAADFPVAVAALGRMRLPKRVDHRVPRVRRDLASALRETGIVAPRPRQAPLGRRIGRRGPRAGHPAAGAARPPLPRLRRPGGARPVGRAARPAGARDRAAAAEGRAPPPTRWPARSTASAPCSASAATSTARPSPPTGRRLARLWGESDLLAAECLRHGVWDGLAPADLAAVVSALVYESRRDVGPVPRVPAGAVSAALTATVGVWADLEADERRHRVERTREPDLGFAWPMHRWARGESLAAVLTAAEQNGAELSAGDFVRWCRQVVDLLDQVADVAGRADGVGRAAADAVTAIRRGVVAVGTGIAGIFCAGPARVCQDPPIETRGDHA